MLSFSIVSLTSPYSEDEHDEHMCDARLCPVPCQLCRRLCANQDHLHGLETDSIHLCGFVSITKLISANINNFFHRQEHPCTALCAAPGVCEIDTTPQSIEATFTGRHETFQYTKVSSISTLRIPVVEFSPYNLVFTRLDYPISVLRWFWFFFLSCQTPPMRPIHPPWGN